MCLLKSPEKNISTSPKGMVKLVSVRPVIMVVPRAGWVACTDLVTHESYYKIFPRKIYGSMTYYRLP